MIHSQKGFTIIEGVIALAIISIMGYVITSGMLNISDFSKSTQVLSEREKQINDIAENIRTSIESYQINFDPSTAAKEAALNVATLPMSWDVGVAVPKGQCISCQGTYGFVIQPSQQYHGLYTVTLRITHKSWSEPFRDYQFVVAIQ